MPRLERRVHYTVSQKTCRYSLTSPQQVLNMQQVLKHAVEQSTTDQIRSDILFDNSK